MHPTRHHTNKRTTHSRQGTTTPINHTQPPRPAKRQRTSMYVCHVRTLRTYLLYIRMATSAKTRCHLPTASQRVARRRATTDTGTYRCDEELCALVAFSLPHLFVLRGFVLRVGLFVVFVRVFACLCCLCLSVCLAPSLVVMALPSMGAQSVVRLTVVG